MVSSQQKTIGIVAMGAALLFLLRGNAKAEELAPLEPVASQPFILPQDQGIQVPTYVEPGGGLAPSPTTESGGDSWVSPIFPRMVTGISSAIYSALKPPPVPTAPTFNIDVFLAGQSDYTQPYSGYIQMASGIVSLFGYGIPMLGTVLAGFLEGILGGDSMAGEATDYDWRVKLQWNELVRMRDLDIISKYPVPQSIDWWRYVVGLGSPSYGNDGPVYTLADIDKIIADPSIPLYSLIVPPEFYNICKQIQKDPTYGMDIVFPQYKDIIKPWYYFVYGPSMARFYVYNLHYTLEASSQGPFQGLFIGGYDIVRFFYQVDPSSNLAAWHKILWDRDERYMGPITGSSSGPVGVYTQIYGAGPVIPVGQTLAALLPPASGNPFLGLSDDQIKFYYEKVLPEINWYAAGFYGTENLSLPPKVSSEMVFGGFGNLDSSPRFDVPKVEFRQVGFGSVVTPNTMKIMREMILNSIRDFYVRRWAEKIIGYADSDYSMAEAIFNFVVSSSRYVPDPVGMELLKIPQIPLQLMAVGEQPALDCDDAAILIGALAMSVGIPYALRAVSFNEEYSHVYGLVQIKERGWVPIDFVVGKRGGNLGDEPEGIMMMKDVEV